MDKKEFFKQRIDKIAKESFNADQKEIAKKIIDNASEDDVDAVWSLINQRVKTGFVFDEAPEINHNCVSYLRENDKLGINLENKNALEHSLIIGENYDALKNLLITYTDKQGKGLIDVIYIDPPYNTEKSKEEGNDYKEDIESKNKFIYRDKYTRDGWLNMMNERLKLAKRLLSDNGVIFISIDENEHAYLKVLCDEIFGEENVDAVIWQKMDSRVDRNTNAKIINRFKSIHESIVLCFNNKNNTIFHKMMRLPEWKKEQKNPDNDPRGPWFSGIMSYEEGHKEEDKTSENYYTVITPTGVEYTRHWFCTQIEFEELKNDNRISFPKNGDGVPRLKIFENEEKEYYMDSILRSVGTSSSAKNEIENILGNRDAFDTPKPTKLLKELIRVSSNNESNILDFFAGSGTTGQAVMELNEEDGGNRKFILVTNNENNIATDITRERLYRVIMGKGSKEESFDWAYSKDKKSLNNNSVRVFDIVKQELNITEIDKAEKIKKEAEIGFTKLSKNYEKKSDINIYNVLASLTPYKEEE